MYLATKGLPMSHRERLVWASVLILTIIGLLYYTDREYSVSPYPVTSVSTRKMQDRVDALEAEAYERYLERRRQ